MYILKPRVFAITRQAVIFQIITFYRTLMNFWLPTQNIKFTADLKND